MTYRPFWLDVGETLPHWEAEQVAFQLTPWLVVSCWIAAVTEVVAPAATELEAAETVTVMCGGGGPMELLVLQLVRKSMDRNVRTETTTHARRVIASSAKARDSRTRRRSPKRGSKASK